MYSDTHSNGLVINISDKNICTHEYTEKNYTYVTHSLSDIFSL